MSKLDRRKFLAASAATAGAAATLSRPAEASHGAEEGKFASSIAVLYDATKCIGCRTCMRECALVNDLPAKEREYRGLKYNMPARLDRNTFTIIQTHQEDEHDASAAGREARWSFVKKNCMHCLEPACVTACPVAALQKTPEGPVVYLEDRCFGCRYCMLACPYQVPKYEWVDRMPRVRKCDWNRACVRVCPTGALIEGPRAEMVKEAHQRIRQKPDRYVDHVYGEHEAGGASQLILAGIEHEKLGLPTLPTTVRSHVAEHIMTTLPGWIIGLGLFLGGVYRATMGKEQDNGHGPATHGRNEEAEA
jgi:Fe-S-cluster-containing dehydrogenase component